MVITRVYIYIYAHRYYRHGKRTEIHSSAYRIIYVTIYVYIYNIHIYIYIMKTYIWEGGVYNQVRVYIRKCTCKHGELLLMRDLNRTRRAYSGGGLVSLFL